MSRPVSHATVIGAIVRKDLEEYTRDRLWTFLTVAVLVAVVVVFWVLPDEVDESIDVGVSGISFPAMLDEVGSADDGMSADLESGDEGLSLIPFDDESELSAVVGGTAEAWQTGGRVLVVPMGSDEGVPEGADKVDISVGLAFPPDFVLSATTGEPTSVNVYVDGNVPDELRVAMSSLVQEMAFTMAGDDLPIDTAEADQVYVVLGEDRVGGQTTPRDAFRPIFVFLVLLMEMFVMASLIAKEMQDRTVTAMLITPATIGDILAAKGISGATSGMAQAVVVLVAINALGTAPVLVLLFMLLGAVMVSGTAMIAGSAGKDFIGTLFYGMAFMIPLMIPAFGALFPGTPSPWIRVLPSFPLVDGLVEITTYGGGWTDTWPQLMALAGWCVVLFTLGWVILRRKVQSL